MEKKEMEKIIDSINKNLELCSAYMNDENSIAVDGNYFNEKAMEYLLKIGSFERMFSGEEITLIIKPKQNLK